MVGEHDFAVGDEANLDVQMGAVEVDAIAAYERLIRHAQARQAAMVSQLMARRRNLASQEFSTTGRWVDDGELVRSVVTEVAMARQVSATGAERQLGIAAGLEAMPRTAELFATGTISERVVRAVTTECAELAPDDAASVDAVLAPELGPLTARRAGQATRRQVLACDPHAAHVRAVHERADRYVAARPGPHGTGYLDSKLSAEQVQACWGALDAAARGIRAAGDGRSLSQIMADTLVQRVTGQESASDVPVEVGLLMRPETLFGAEDTPALLAGYGPVPAGLARAMTAATRVSVLRLFTDPADDVVTGRDPRRRRFDGPLGELIRAADQDCQRPWCDGRIADIDHRTPYAAGGATIRANADSYCRRSHLTRHLSGWQTRCVQHHGDTPQVIEWLTPTGHRYRSRRPHPLGHGPPVIVPRRPPVESLGERRLRNLLDGSRANASAPGTEAA